LTVSTIEEPLPPESEPSSSSWLETALTVLFFFKLANELANRCGAEASTTDLRLEFKFLKFKTRLLDIAKQLKKR
jgi:hypothetical protein